MTILKQIGAIVIVLIVIVLMVWFTSLNPGEVTIDLAFGIVQPTISLAFAVCFTLGWAFGLFCTSFYVLRLLNERRRLRNEHRATASELKSLRNLPIADAD